jgi:uncharacterized DUF497 family protein
MKFTWDEKKRKINILNHGFDFIDAKEIFEGVTLTLKMIVSTTEKNASSPLVFSKA